jgi:hypothetical protein
MAYAVLTGAGDNAAAGDQHNGIYYARPDGRIVFLPHDMDFSFSETRSITANPQCATLTQQPARRRLYLGHLHDIITTTYHNAYMSIWTSHFAALHPQQDWAAELTYMTNRSNNVLNQIRSAIPQTAFAITTPGPLSVNGSTATLSGTGWVNVRSIRIAGSTEPLSVTWTANSTWQLKVPANPGSRTVTLEAIDFSGKLISSASIVIENTSPVEPASAANLVVSEIMYHPAPPSPTELSAGFTDADQFEFIELTNAGKAPVSLDNVRFTDGITFAFAPGRTLPPGGRTLTVRDRAAFASRYPLAAAFMADGAFTGGTGLNNNGETLTLVGADGFVIRSFAYRDSAPWPTTPDGSGPSLVLIAPASLPDHSIAANWRASTADGGNPANSDATPFTGNPSADDDADGLPALMEYALGSSDSTPDLSRLPSATLTPDGFMEFTFTRNPAAEDATLVIESSPALQSWSTGGFAIVSESARPDGSLTVTARSLTPATGSLYARLKAALR